MDALTTVGGYFTGGCEVLYEVGLPVASLQRSTGIALILFFVAVFPANVHASRAGVQLRARPATVL